MSWPSQIYQLHLLLGWVYILINQYFIMKSYKMQLKLSE